MRFKISNGAFMYYIYLNIIALAINKFTIQF